MLTTLENVRNEQGLKDFLLATEELREELYDAADMRKSDRLKLVIENDNLIEVAQIMTRAALYRQESRGGHYREDFPTASDDHLHSVIHDRTVENGYFTSPLVEMN